MSIPMEIKKNYGKKIEEARLSADSIEDFFQKYAEILAELKVDIKFIEYPWDLIDADSSHDSPIGRPQAWSSEAKANPDIPNTYRAYSGTLRGTITNNSEMGMGEINAHRLFWHFGPFDKEWIHAKPGNCNVNGNVETFSLDCRMFIEDFPVMYREMRKENTLHELNTSLDNALDNYEYVFKDMVDKRINDDQILADITRHELEIENTKQSLRNARNTRIKMIRNEVNEIKMPFPVIESKYLSLKRYHSLVDSHKVTEIPTPEYKEVYDNLNKIGAKMRRYLKEHLEDFL